MTIPRGRDLVLAAFVAAIVVSCGTWIAGRLPPPGAAARTAAAAVRPGAAYAWLTDFQEHFPFRRARSKAHAGGVEYIVAALTDAGCTDVRVERLVRGSGRGADLANVHAVIPGRDRSREVVLAAHHDTVDDAPGAIDDGGAIAAIVEAARVLAAGPPPACDVHVAIFDGEEWGLLGSKAHVEAIGEDGRARVAAALAVELVGWRKDSLVAHTIPNGFAWHSAGIAPAWVPASIVRAGDAADAPVVVGDPWIGPWYRESGAATIAFSLVLAAAAVATSVGGLIVGVPLAVALAAAALWPRVAPLFILLGFVPLLVGVTATVGASTMFGFEWCGGPLEAAVEIAMVASALVAAVLARLAARHG